MSTIAEADARFRLMADISGAIYDDFCNRSSYQFGDEDFELEDSDAGEPFVLTRKSDGAQFEVELVAEVALIPADDPPGSKP